MADAKTSVSVSFRAPQAQIRKLDSLAKRQRRDRTQLIGEAIEQYLKLHEFHLKQIDEGIAAADRGDFASDAEIEAMFARLRRKA
jgi:predicted transcriptional regulator